MPPLHVLSHILSGVCFVLISVLNCLQKAGGGLFPRLAALQRDQSLGLQSAIVGMVQKVGEGCVAFLTPTLLQNVAQKC